MAGNVSFLERPLRLVFVVAALALGAASVQVTAAGDEGKMQYGGQTYCNQNCLDGPCCVCQNWDYNKKVYPDSSGHCPGGQYPDYRRLCPDEAGKYPNYMGLYPDCNGHYPDYRGRYPDCKGHYPSYYGQYFPC